MQRGTWLSAPPEGKGGREGAPCTSRVKQTPRVALASPPSLCTLHRRPSLPRSSQAGWTGQAGPRHQSGLGLESRAPATGSGSWRVSREPRPPREPHGLAPRGGRWPRASQPRPGLRPQGRVPCSLSSSSPSASWPCQVRGLQRAAGGSGRGPSPHTWPGRGPQFFALWGVLGPSEVPRGFAAAAGARGLSGSLPGSFS